MMSQISSDSASYIGFCLPWTSIHLASSEPPRLTTRTFRTPCCSKPVAASVTRTAWCSPAVSLNGSRRSVTATRKAASSSSAGEGLGRGAARAVLRGVPAGGADEVEGVIEAGARDLEVAGHAGQPRQVAADGCRVRAEPLRRRLHADQLEGVVGAARAERGMGVFAVDVEDQGQPDALVGRQVGPQLGHPRGRAEEGADELRPAGRAYGRVLLQSLVHRRVAGREEGGVVDEAGEQRTRDHLMDPTGLPADGVRVAGWPHALLPPGGRDPAQAPHAVPPARRQPLRRGADGRRGVLVGRLAALPPAHPDGDRVERGLRRADLPPAAQPPAQAAPLQDPQARRRRGSQGRRARPAAPDGQRRRAHLLRRRDRAVAALPQRDR